MQDWKDSAVLPHHPVLHMKASQPQQFFISIITLLSGRNQPLVTGAANGFVSFIGGVGGGGQGWGVGGGEKGEEGGRGGKERMDAGRAVVNGYSSTEVPDTE